jgi:hypothetical protein
MKNGIMGNILFNIWKELNKVESRRKLFCNIEIQPTQVRPDTWKNITSIANLVKALK